MLTPLESYADRFCARRFDDTTRVPTSLSRVTLGDDVVLSTASEPAMLTRGAAFMTDDV